MHPSIAAATTFDDIVAAGTTGEPFFDQFRPRHEGTIDILKVPTAMLVAASTVSVPLLASLVGWAVPRNRRQMLIGAYIAAQTSLSWVDVAGGRDQLLERIRNEEGPAASRNREFALGFVADIHSFSARAAYYFNGSLDAQALFMQPAERQAYFAKSDPDRLRWDEGNYLENVHNWVCGILDFQRACVLEAHDVMRASGILNTEVIDKLNSQVPHFIDRFLSDVARVTLMAQSSTPDPEDALLRV